MKKRGLIIIIERERMKGRERMAREEERERRKMRTRRKRSNIRREIMFNDVFPGVGIIAITI